jgi:hypothetical protein
MLIKNRAFGSIFYGSFPRLAMVVMERFPAGNQNPSRSSTKQGLMDLVPVFFATSGYSAGQVRGHCDFHPKLLI